jgi:ABC-type nickel/cobalt efflux system permease component RcnA
MFCPSCGAETSEGLSYCKRCGAKLGAARGDDSRPRVAGLVWAVSTAIVLVTLVGFTVMLGFIVEFGRDASNRMIGLVALLLVVVLAVDYLLVRQLSRLLSFHLHGGDGRARAEQLRPAAQPSAQLEAPRPPAYGDLEQTTRTLDPAPRERDPR